MGGPAGGSETTEPTAVQALTLSLAPALAPALTPPLTLSLPLSLALTLSRTLTLPLTLSSCGGAREKARHGLAWDGAYCFRQPPNALGSSLGESSVVSACSVSPGPTVSIFGGCGVASVHTEHSSQ